MDIGSEQTPKIQASDSPVLFFFSTSPPHPNIELQYLSTRAPGQQNEVDDAYTSHGETPEIRHVCDIDVGTVSEPNPHEVSHTEQRGRYKQQGLTLNVEVSVMHIPGRE